MTPGPPRSGLLVGRVSHSRLTPRPHAFAYDLFMLRLDLAEIAALDAGLKAFGTRWWKAIRFEQPFKDIGVYDVVVHLHADVNTTGKVWVVQAKPA